MPGVHEGLDQLGRGPSRREALAVGQGLLPGVLNTQRLHLVVERDPHASSGNGCRSSHFVGALQRQHLSTVVSGQDGCGKAGASGADHHHVDLLIPVPCCHDSSLLEDLSLTKRLALSWMPLGLANVSGLRDGDRGHIPTPV